MSSTVDSNDTEADAGRWEQWTPRFLVGIPILFNASMLWPQLLPMPYFNDNAWHYLFIKRASEALSIGSNPFDFWVPELGFGFPQFLYYQHLPHLAVVLLYELLFHQIDLLTLFNFVQYALLVLFPLTVYWSLRTMEFPPIGSAFAAACASLISANPLLFGIDYHSYINLGFGMYTQLWAMHLYFLSLATLQCLMTRGTGYLSAICLTSMLLLSHPLYAYMAAISVLVLFFVDLREERTA